MSKELRTSGPLSGKTVEKQTVNVRTSEGSKPMEVYNVEGEFTCYLCERKCDGSCVDDGHDICTFCYVKLSHWS